MDLGRIILIIDQFEELFIQFRREKDRSKIAYEINDWINKRRLRILCVIRRDYYLDFNDFATEIIEPTSARNTFNLRNFEVEEAAKVILECARVDQIAITEDTAILIAEDLSDKGEVRPAELQIVCTALRGNFDTQNYRSSGGAARILSHYISQAIEGSGNPPVARSTLRSLCDFAGNAKTPPQTLTQLVALVGQGRSPDEPLDLVVGRVFTTSPVVSWSRAVRKRVELRGGP